MNELDIINQQLKELRQAYNNLDKQGKITYEYDQAYCVLVQTLCEQRTLIYWRKLQE